MIEESSECLELIKSAPRRLLSDEEAIDFISQPFYLGLPKLFYKKPKRGKQSCKTQYDISYERRKGIFHDLIRLKSVSPSLAGRGRLLIGQHTEAIILRVAKLLLSKKPDIPFFKLTSAIERALHSSKLPIYHRTTIKRCISKNKNFLY